MESLRRRWYNVPTTVRKPIVLLIGMLVVIVSPFAGLIPGPGGMLVFLIGIAILSTEFEWAKRLRVWTVRKIHWLGQLWRAHKVIGTLVLLAFIAVAVTLSTISYRYFSR